MKINSTRTLTVELDDAVAGKLANALTLAIQGASIEMVNSGAVDILCALRNGLRNEMAGITPRPG